MKHYLHHLHLLTPVGSGIMNSAPSASLPPGLGRHRKQGPGRSSWPLMLLLLLLLTLFRAPAAQAQVFGGKVSFCEPNPPIQTYSIGTVAGATNYSWSITTPGNSTNAKILNPVGQNPSDVQSNGPNVTSVTVFPGDHVGRFDLVCIVLRGTGAPVVAIQTININFADAGLDKFITCGAPTVQLGEPLLRGPGPSFSWTGPGITTANSTQQQPTVSVPGIYTLTVRTTNDVCVATDQVEVFGPPAGVACGPVLAAIINKTVNETVAMPVIGFSALDFDTPQSGLTFTVPEMPPGAVFNPTTRALTWTPTESQGPGVYPVTVKVSDGTAEDTKTFNITVNEANVAPTIAGGILAQNGAVGQLLTFPVTGADTDLPAQTLDFSMVANNVTTQPVPAGATLTTVSPATSPQTGLFAWTPTTATVGRFTLRAQVRDGVTTGLVTFFTTINAPPVLATIGPKTATVGQLLTFPVSGTDINNAGTGGVAVAQTRTFSLVGQPTDKGTLGITTVGGTTITPATSTITGTFSWTPTVPGTYTFKVRLADNGAIPLADEEEITVEVRGVQHALTVTPPVNGTITKDPNQATYDAGTEVSLTANPNPGFRFVSWGGDASGTTATTTITMNGPKTVSATFEWITYTLTTDVAPAGGGTITRSVPGPDYPFGTGVILTAVPEEGYRFVSWTGATATGPTAIVTMDDNKTVTANFEVIPPTLFTLATNVDPLGSGSVTLSEPGPDYVSGTEVTLTAVPEGGYRFVNWTGASATGPTTIVTMDGNKTVTANFERITFTLTTNVVPAGSGTIARSPDSPNYNSGTEVTLTAMPASGFRFVNWTGASGTGNTATMTMDEDKTVSANFERIIFTLTTNVSPVGSGSITRSAPGPDYVSGTEVTLTAVPATGFRFVSWSGATGTGNTATVTMDESKTITATFELIPPTLFTLATGASPVANGTVARSAAGPNYLSGTTVTLTASPAPGFQFSGWSGDATGSTNPLSVLMNANKNITATFAALPGQHMVSFSLINATNEQVIQTIAPGEVINLAALPSRNLNIRANTSPVTVGSVRFVMTGTVPRTQVETGAPYALFGDNNGNYNNWVTPVGNYILTCTPFTGANAAGTAGTPLVISFSVIDQVAPPAQFTLAATSLGNGTVSKSLDQATYTSGSTVTLTANPAPGYLFAGWSGDATGSTTPLPVLMNANKNISASFTLAPVQQSLAVSIVGSGTVTRSPNQASYNQGSTVQLTAVPAPGFEFVEWSGDATGTASSTSLTMDANKNVTATFRATTVQFNLAVTIVGGGRVTPSTPGPGYLSGTTVTLTASPAPGFQFSGWSGDATGSTNPLAVLMNANKNITATFTAVAGQQVLSFSLINATNEQVIQTIAPGEVINLAALPSRNLNIRANTSPVTVGSVRFVMTGTVPRTQVETGAPYALFGDNNGNYNNWATPVGNYILTCTPFTGANAAGTAGTPLVISFSVINQPVGLAAARMAQPQERVQTPQLLKAYPNPSPDGRMKVQLPATVQGKVAYSLVTLVGQQVARGELSLTQATSQLEFDFSGQMKTSGVYYLRLEGSHLKQVLKLMK